MTAPIITTSEVGAALPIWLSAAEVGKLVGKSGRTIRAMVYSGRGPARRGPAYEHRVYHLPDVLRWLESRGQLDPRWRPYMEAGRD